MSITLKISHRYNLREPSYVQNSQWLDRKTIVSVDDSFYKKGLLKWLIILKWNAIRLFQIDTSGSDT